jgi:Cys-rich protein (TIGR01571 family)
MSQPEMSQPAGQYMAAPAGSQQPVTYRQGEWSTSFFGCFNDLATCAISCLVPCFQYAWNKERAENKDGWIMDCCIYTWCSCIAPCLGAGVRGNIRNRSGIEVNLYF